MEGAEYQRQLLRDVFGGSSDSEEEEAEVFDEVSSSLNNQSTDAERGLPLSASIPNPSRSWSWQRIEAINGLWLCTDFLSPQQQSSLLFAIKKEGWFIELSHNQAMRFGDLPFWADELSDCIREAICGSERETNIEDSDNEASILPSQLLLRDPFFDQLIANVYQPGERGRDCSEEFKEQKSGTQEGICAHVDLMRFEDGIAIVSLESPCVMHFSPVQQDGEELPLAMKIPVYLNPGSLVIMWGDARYCWKHEINRRPGFQVWQGQAIEQKQRTSITLRKLRISE